MPIVYDEEWGGNRLVLNQFISLEEAVILLLGKSLADYPFEYFDEAGKTEGAYTLEDYLQYFYEDDDQRELATQGLEFHEKLLDAFEKGELKQYANGIRLTKLIVWAKAQNITIESDLPSHVIEANNSKVLNKFPQQERAILEMLTSLGFVDHQRLPNEMPGRPGVKSEVRQKLLNLRIFQGETVFDKAWDRLLFKGKIKRQK